MNTDLKQFLIHIRNKNNIKNPDNYISNRKIHDNNLTLTCGYLAGSAYISGIAFDKSIKIIYNYFNCDGFYVTIDELSSAIPICFDNILHFFEVGDFYPGTILG